MIKVLTAERKARAHVRGLRAAVNEDTRTLLVWLPVSCGVDALRFLIVLFSLADSTITLDNERLSNGRIGE